MHSVISWLSDKFHNCSCCSIAVVAVAIAVPIVFVAVPTALSFGNISLKFKLYFSCCDFRFHVRSVCVFSTKTHLFSTCSSSLKTDKRAKQIHFWILFALC